jgi:hypothetical protein
MEFYSCDPAGYIYYYYYYYYYYYSDCVKFPFL